MCKVQNNDRGELRIICVKWNDKSMDPKLHFFKYLIIVRGKRCILLFINVYFHILYVNPGNIQSLVEGY